MFHDEKRNTNAESGMSEREAVEITTDELTPLPDSLEPSEKVKSERRAGWLIRDVFEWGETLVTAMVFILLVFTFALRITSVDGPSMQPTLHNKDQLLVTNFFYTPKVNDIVIVFAPHLKNDDGSDGKNIIKRVVGVENDVIRIDAFTTEEGRSGGIVYRNGEPLEIVWDGEHLVEDGHLINDYTTSLRHTDIEVTVGPGQIFVLGDNRSNSSDSRSENVGLIDVNHVAGRAFLRLLGDADEYGGSLLNAFGLLV
ncbi:MAG: signal peptidase I [Oscillospiraceae bacterium]|nr:signal peptidase I [Oscillospiraceae bacterium]